MLPIMLKNAAPFPQIHLAVGRLLRDVAGGDGTLRMAARNLSCVREVSSQCAWLNAPGRLEKIESTLELARSLEAPTAEEKVKCF